MPPSLDTIPLEVLERIASFVAWHQFTGPPKDLASLCLTCKHIHDSLSFSRNPPLYASLFRYKFDIAAPRRRLSSEYTSAQCLAGEFRRRFEAMARIRRGVGSHSMPAHVDRQHDLWMAVLMMLENDGKNAIQLRTFGRVQDWLQAYFLEPPGGSYIHHDMQVRSWPRDNIDNKLALWLLSLLDADKTTTPSDLYTELLRSYAIGANRYPLTATSWIQFSLPDRTQRGTPYRHFSRQLYLTPPATAISAVSGYIARLREPESTIFASTNQVNSESHGLTSHREADWGSIQGSSSQRWDCVWERCIGFGLDGACVDPTNGLARYYRPGSLEGSWEGLFTYAEFGVYAAMLSGEPPHCVTEGTIGHHPQVWKVREYHLYASSTSLSDNHVLPPGAAAHAFFPLSSLVEEHDQYAVFTHSSQSTIYQRAQVTGDNSDRGTLRDVILLGEVHLSRLFNSSIYLHFAQGHSAWGSFNLRGRVRPADAFITVLKEYSGPEDRGKWLYRGYLFGDRFVGRWRDVLTPVSMVGYEGGFDLAQREA
ncbi:hypothetical protein JB92DRAFT_2799925 [Gautieria morchelliformis]|nr:hypothetical protein JB92DRAFT_2799925 [Gautieria morchelliformis]